MHPINNTVVKIRLTITFSGASLTSTATGQSLEIAPKDDITGSVTDSGFVTARVTSGASLASQFSKVSHQ